MSDPAAITPAQFASMASAVGLNDPATPIAVAVSGGADSMALALLAAEWGQSVVALHVDHGLRPTSAEEAQKIGGWLAARDIPFVILAWQGAKPGQDIQQAARANRYALMEAYCREHAIGHLLLAHHLDDQAETLLLRLARGSGVRGLAAMRPVAPPLSRGHSLPMRLRPLLAVTKERLEASLKARAQDWLHDPSNSDERYARTAVRRLLAARLVAGLTRDRLAKTAGHLARASLALDHYVRDLSRQSVTSHPAGAFCVDITAWHQAPDEIQLRLLSDLLACFSLDGKAPRFDELDPLLQGFLSSDFAGQTLGGCQIFADRGETRWICRELAAAPAMGWDEPETPLLWDSRFIFTSLRAGKGPWSVRPLGEDGVAWVRKHYATMPDFEALPGPVRASLPGLWTSGTFVTAPFLNEQIGPVQQRSILVAPHEH